MPKQMFYPNQYNEKSMETLQKLNAKPLTQWDYVLMEAKLMALDFREERKSKIAISYQLAKKTKKYLTVKKSIDKELQLYHRLVSSDLSQMVMKEFEGLKQMKRIKDEQGVEFKDDISFRIDIEEDCLSHQSFSTKKDENKKSEYLDEQQMDYVKQEIFNQSSVKQEYGCDQKVAQSKENAKNNFKLNLLAYMQNLVDNFDIFYGSPIDKTSILEKLKQKLQRSNKIRNQSSAPIVAGLKDERQDLCNNFNFYIQI